jgi:hypothetical protein
LCVTSTTAVLNSSSDFGVRIISSSNSTECRYSVCNRIHILFHLFIGKFNRY